MRGGWDRETLEMVVRFCLTEDPDASHVALSERLGQVGIHCSRETVRHIRSGQTWANILPELPRADFNYGKRCWQCQFISDDNKRCTLDIPEAKGTDRRMAMAFAVRCSSFMEKDHAVG